MRLISAGSLVRAQSGPPQKLQKQFAALISGPFFDSQENQIINKGNCNFVLSRAQKITATQNFKNRQVTQGHMMNALALAGDEGRDKLR